MEDRNSSGESSEKQFGSEFISGVVSGKITRGTTELTKMIYSRYVEMW